jgi:type II secretory pathway pseudopilin PulG
MKGPSLKRQSGWSLVETAIATALLGMMVVAVITTARKATDNVVMQQRADDTERAENALIGYTRSHARMPTPDASTPSPSRPGYIEGWLPATELGIHGLTGRIRYVVAKSLAEPQAIYSPDPLNLAGGAINVRTKANGLDFCATLMRRELAGDALPGGMRLGYALQQAVSNESGLPVALSQSWLGDTVSGPLPAGARLNSRTRGFGELAESLDCFARFSDLSRDVRATAVSIDLGRLAEQEIALREVQLQMGNDSRLNNEIRMAAWGLGGLKLASDAVMETVTILTSPTATVAGAANVASLWIVVAGLADLLELTGKNIAGAEKDKTAQEAAIASAKDFRDRIAQETQRQTLKVNQSQDKGLSQ